MTIVKKKTFSTVPCLLFISVIAPMAASSGSVGSHHAAQVSSDNTTVALVSYNIGINNDEITRPGWANREGKLARLKSDVEKKSS